MTPTSPTTAGEPDPGCIACGIEDACAYHAADGDTESAMRETSAAVVGRVREMHPAHGHLSDRRPSRDVAADLGLDELDPTPSVETLRARSHAHTGNERELAAVTSARRDLAHQVDLEPVTPPRVREAARPDARSIANDLGLDEDELVPLKQLREAGARRAAMA
jgi:hypothetical protein